MKRIGVLVEAAMALALASGCAAGSDGSPTENGGVIPPATGSPAGGLTGAAGTDSTTRPPGGSTLPPSGTGSAPPAGAGDAGRAADGMPGTIAMGGAGVSASAGVGGSTVPPTGGGVAPTPTLGASEPTIPALTAQCPDFGAGSITFMGLGGITIAAGPKAASATAPLVFYWHGTGGLASEYALQATAVASGVQAEGGLLISFQDTVGGDLLSGTFIFGAGDFDLTDQLVACAVQNYNVDPRRIFATGCSAGGLFSGAMAAARSQYMAAAAPNSGGWVLPVAFANDHTPALMTIHGAPGVDVVVIDFSDASATADKGFKDRGGFVINCNHGGGHCGGGGFAPDIWEFFKAHPYGVDPEPWTSLPPGFNSVCQIY